MNYRLLQVELFKTQEDVNDTIYVLGTGLSHDGSAVLLKNGKVCIAIEKERLTRKKHDGGNDTVAIQYCLDAEGITLEDISLVVQCANFEIPERDYHRGKRLFTKKGSPEVVNISHHLAHAYSAVGTSPFNECAVMVIDGCGSPLEQYLALHPEEKHLIADTILTRKVMQCEKDSFYHFDGKKLQPLWKDFSTMTRHHDYTLQLPSTQHSIGGFYAAISHYVFGNMDDVGKLMGLAPFGKSGVYELDAFTFRKGTLEVIDEWKAVLTNPSPSYAHFKQHFEYYANIAKWAQEQVEEAVIQCISSRMEKFPHQNLCYSGGVALNAAANRKLIETNIAENIYFEPAAADNGLALGCAFYGWLAYLDKDKVPHNGDTCFGKVYPQKDILKALKKERSNQYTQKVFVDENEMLQHLASELNSGKTVAWFQAGSEFGPRSLGRRSILAHPGKDNLQYHINTSIKFREDFRPFAPAVLKNYAHKYFVAGRESPYMILLDHTRQEYINQLQNVTHCDGTARIQTVDDVWNPKFTKLLKAFQVESGIPILLNTSLNKKGMPMVETPEEAMILFKETALEILVLENTVLTKK
ncbi:carbamoyltransferase C-terminal domain-containing protein [Dokdonia ponticola]|uniref:Carbamoyltransferase C-terminal domain-containing protein n=1 Tax=Dokdonia ponticola TaxID=2041041 RepID=A0ABV9HW81_9FLAO